MTALIGRGRANLSFFVLEPRPSALAVTEKPGLSWKQLATAMRSKYKRTPIRSIKKDIVQSQTREIHYAAKESHVLDPANMKQA